MTLEEARELFANTRGQVLIGDIDSDCDAALAEQQRISGDMDLFPGSVQTDYRRAATDLERAQDAFTAAVNQILNGRARDGRQALATYRTYVVALLRLQGLNARNGAFVDAGVAAALSHVFAMGARVMTGTVDRETRAMIRDLGRIRDRLTSARRHVTTAQVLRALNVILTTLGGVLGAIERFRRLALAIEVGGTIVTTVLQASMGPSPPTDLDYARSGLDNMVEAAGEINPCISALHTISGGIMDLVSDSTAVGEAQEELERVQGELARAERTFSAYNRHVASAVREVSLAKQLARGAYLEARSDARAYREAAADYRDLERMLAEIE